MSFLEKLFLKISHIFKVVKSFEIENWKLEKKIVCIKKALPFKGNSKGREIHNLG